LRVAIGLLIGLGLGFGGGWFVRGRRRPRNLAQPIALPPPLALPLELTVSTGTTRIWVAPDARARQAIVSLLASHGLRGRPVLVVPAEESRDVHRSALEGIFGVYWLSVVRPEVAPVLHAADALSPLGAAVLVVEGAIALEAPAEEEPPDAVLEELLDLAEQETWLILDEGEPSPRTPDIRLVACEGGLALRDGPQVLRWEGQRLVFASENRLG
jgi:hypothetical protein